MRLKESPASGIERERHRNINATARNHGVYDPDFVISLTLNTGFSRISLPDPRQLPEYAIRHTSQMLPGW